MTTTGIKLDPETHERLKYLAKAKDRTVHWLMKEAIGRYVTEEERYEREKTEDEARYQHYLETGVHVTHEEMLEFLDELDAEIQRKTRVE
jgi:predicted transcriptional regulator